jgi:hypothetical protein
MIINDATIIERNVEEWTREIELFIDKFGDNMSARNILPQRTVGADTAIDVVTSYDRTGPGAQIVAKGSVPDTTGQKANTAKYDIFQISTAFNVNAKDLKLDPKLKNRQIDIMMRDIHKKEDQVMFNGDSSYGITGLIGTAQANDNGKIVASGASGSDTDNNGAWAGEIGTDIYDDINNAIGKMDEDFEPTYLIGNRSDLLYLNRMDSERQPYYKSISGLFGKKNPDDKSWMWMTNQFDTGKVYLATKDFLAAEFVISENPRIVPYPIGPGENYRFEINSWSIPEFFNDEAFVEIAIT